MTKQTITASDIYGIPRVARNRLRNPVATTRLLRSARNDFKVTARGFTILEVIMLIVILGVLAAVVAVSFSTYRNVQLDGAADKLVSDIRYCQQLALNAPGIYSVVFESASNRYTLYYFDGTSLVDIQNPVTKTTPYRISYGSGDYTGMTLTSASFNGSESLRFTARGIPQDGTNVNLAAAGSVVITNVSGSSTISITPDTGMVSRT